MAHHARCTAAVLALLLTTALLLSACGGGDGLTRAEVEEIVREEMAAASAQTDSSPGMSPAQVEGIVNDGSEGNPLANTEWRLVALGNADAPAEVVGGNVTAEFTTATDVTGWTGCNSYAARYSAQGSGLRLDALTWTEKGCPSQALFRQEQRMQDSLATVERFEVLGGQLTLHSEGGQVLVFERVGK